MNKTKTPNLKNNKKLQAPRLAYIFALVAGIASLYVSLTVLIDPEGALNSIFNSTEPAPDFLAHSWVVRNTAIGVLLLFAAATKRPLVLFSAIMARAVTEFGDIIVTITSQADNLQVIPMAALLTFEIFVLTRMRKTLRF